MSTYTPTAQEQASVDAATAWMKKGDETARHAPEELVSRMTSEGTSGVPLMGIVYGPSPAKGTQTRGALAAVFSTVAVMSVVFKVAGVISRRIHRQSGNHVKHP